MFEAPRRKVDRVFIHCSASDLDMFGRDLLKEITIWHQKRGWSTIGYHYLIDKAGEIIDGRDLEKTPAAQKGHNTGTVAICVHGLRYFTDEAIAALKDLTSQINLAYSGKISFHGHCEVSNKSCPIIDYRTILELDRFQRMK